METDLLGPPYERQTIDLGRDHEGPVAATLVRRLAAPPHRARAAVLYVHGYIDYFFQTHLADFYVDLGLDFYALELRKYGRSLARHQTPNDCRDIREYYPELDEAARIIREVDGHSQLLVNGHSTGGLVTALWAHDRREAGLVDALFLNSPFFEFNAPWLLRRVVGSVLSGIGWFAPATVIPLRPNDVYGRSIHHTYHGSWEYDLAWKPLTGFEVRAGWLRAVRAAQRRVRAGLDIRVPVLVATSAASYRSPRWGEAARTADSVLNIDDMARWTPSLGRNATLVKIEGGLHDLALSDQPYRRRLFDEVERWLAGSLRSVNSPGAHPTAPSAAPSHGRAAPADEG